MTLMVSLLLVLHPMDPPLSSVSLTGTRTESQPGASETVPPAKTVEPETPVQPAQPQTVSRWKRVIIHQSDQLPGTMAEMETRYAQSYNGCPYHFVIEADGSYNGSARWYRQAPVPAALEPADIGEVHVALVGTSDRNPPTAMQVRARDALVKWLVEKFGVPRDAIETR
jgi:hypothetical protein